MATALGCSSGAQNEGFAVEVTATFVASVSDAQLDSITSLSIVGSGGESYTKTEALNRSAHRVEKFIYRPLSSTRTLSITLGALDVSNEIVADGSTGDLLLTPNTTIVAEITMTPPLLNDLGIDGFANPDSGKHDASEPDGGTVEPDGGQAAGQIAFLTAARTPTAASPVDIAAADFNGDKIPDVVVATAAGGKVQVFFTQKGGTLPATPSFESTAVVKPVALAIADVNADGISDILVLDGSDGSLLGFISDGKGGFQTSPRQTGATGADSMVSADFDHDGTPDVALASSTIAKVWILYSSTDTTVSYPTHAPVKRLHAVDFDRDGYVDLAMVSTDVQIFTNTQKTTPTTFAQPIPDFASPTTPTEVLVFDVDDDGDNDVMILRAANAGGACTVFVNASSTFTAHNIVGPYYEDSIHHAQAIDLDGDGRMDVLATQANPGGNGNYQNFLTTLNKASGAITNFFNVDNVNAYSLESNPGAFATADFDGDGHLDAAVVNQASNSISLVRGLGAQQFYAASEPVGGYDQIAFYDFDGNGTVDIIDHNAAGAIYLFPGDGLGNFGGGPQISFNNVSSSALGDLDGDGKPDIAMCSFSGMVGISLGLGAGSFKAPISTTYGGSFVDIAMFDITLDGNLDLVLLDNSGTANGNGKNIVVLPGNGKGAFGTPITGAAANPLHSIIGDFNGDKVNDVAVLSTEGQLTVFITPTAGGLGAPKTGVGFAPNPVEFTKLDANHDGILDLAVAGDNVHVLTGKGDGTFTDAGVVYASASNGVAAGDVDGDGHDDLVVATAYSVLILPNATVRVGAPLEFSAGDSLRYLYAANLTTDARVEVVALGQTGTLLVNETK